MNRQQDKRPMGIVVQLKPGPVAPLWSPRSGCRAAWRVGSLPAVLPFVRPAPPLEGVRVFHYAPPLVAPEGDGYLVAIEVGRSTHVFVSEGHALEFNHDRPWAFDGDGVARELVVESAPAWLREAAVALRRGLLHEAHAATRGSLG